MGGGLAIDSGENPVHQYADTGTYQVKLVVINSNGCPDSLTLPVTIFSKPQASFTINTLCERNPAAINNLTMVANDSITGWHWDFGNGDSALVELPLLQYDSAGTFNVTLRVESSNGCRDTTQQSVLVQETPDVAFAIDNTCAGSNTQFTNQSQFASGTTTVFWDFDDGGTSTMSDPPHQFQNNGTFDVSLTVTGSNGCVDSLIIPTGISNPASPAFSLNPSTVCQFGATQFTDNSTINVDSINTWNWNFGNGDSLLVQHPVYAYQAVGNFTVSLTVNVGTDCQTSTSQAIEVLPAPQPAFSFTHNCQGDSVRFTDGTLPAADDPVNVWQWDFGDGGLSTVANPSHVYQDSGLAIVALTVTSDSGCLATFTDSVTVFAPPQAAFTVDPPVQCSGLEVDFTSIATSPSGNPIVDHEWRFFSPNSGLIDSSAFTDVTLVFDSALVYTESLEVSTMVGCSNRVD
ncbi:MAG: PKD domain-containing protein, partial [Bacteroidota bacterium]